MAQLLLFGLSCPLTAAGAQAPQDPNIHVVNWTSSRTGQRVTIAAVLKVGAQATLTVDLDVMVAAAGADFAPANGPQPTPRRIELRSSAATSHPSAMLAVELGGLAFFAASMPSTAARGLGGKLWFALAPAPRQWFRAETCGLQFDYGPGSLHLDLAADKVELEQRFLQGTVNAVVDLASHILPCFERSFGSAATQLPINDPSSVRRFPLVPDQPAEPLVLHTELLRTDQDPSAANPLIGALGLTNYRLDCTFGPSTGRDPILTALSAAPLAANLSLTSYFLQTPLNTAITWTSTDVIPLALRPASDPRKPSSLMIARLSGRLPTARRAAPDPVHGLVSSVVFDIPRVVSLSCDQADPGAPLPNIASDLLSNATLPFLANSTSTSLSAPYPGEAYTDGTSSNVSRMAFAGKGGAVPLVPTHQIRASKTASHAFLSALNASWSLHSFKIPATVHETNLKQAVPANAPPVTLHQVFTEDDLPKFLLGAPPLPPTQRVEPATYKLDRDYGWAVVHLEQDPGVSQDYLVISDPSQIDLTLSQLEPGRTEFIAKSPPRSSDGRQLGIVKLSDRYSLAEIFALLKWPTALSDEPGRDLVDNVIDAVVLDKSWRGLILFDVPVDFDKFMLLRAMTTEPLALRYLAFTPALDPPAKGAAPVSVSGRIVWTNIDTTNGAQAPDSEVRFRTEGVEVAWLDSRLTEFRSKASVYFDGALGLEYKSGPAPSLQIIGSYSDAAFNFASALSKPMPLLDPANGFGPIAQIWLKGVDIVEAPKGVTIEMNGDLELRSLPWKEGNWVDSPQGRLVRFRKFGILLPTPGTDMPRGYQWLRLSYPTLELDLDQNHYRLFDLEALQLKLQSIGISWDDSFSWEDLFPVYGGFNGNVSRFIFLMTLRLQLMQLPELAEASVKSLMLDFVIGLRTQQGRWTPDNFEVAVSALGFEGLHLALMRFLEVNIAKIELQRKLLANGRTVSWFDLGGANISILGTTVVQDMSAAIFTTPDGQRGFFAYLDNVYKNGIIDVEWALIGQNISLAQPLAQALLEAGTNSDPAAVRTLIQNNSDPDHFMPGNGAQAVGEWVFAAGLTIAGGMFKGKFLFQDRTYYGIAIAGDLLDQWFGYKLELSILYVRGARPEEDSFAVTFTVPRVAIGAVMFTGGVVGITIAMNGGFLLDIGFPWRDQNGLRAWTRTLGAIVTPFQGSGGFYVAKRSAITRTNGTMLRLSAGYAVQAGLGATYGGGAFTVWVRAGVFAVLEGDTLLDGNNLAGLRISGSIGVLLEGGGEINWWIISARVDVMASAEAMATLQYGLDPDTLQPFPGGGAMSVRFDFNLCARASASACIGSGMFKICRGIDVSVSMPFQYTMLLG